MERNSTTHASEQEEASGNKGGKRKAIFKKTKTQQGDPSTSGDAASAQSLGKAPEAVSNRERDPEILVRIRERAYGFFQAGGFEHGHDLEHWFEAERQLTGSSD